MKTLSDPAVVVEVKERLNALCPGSERMWGKMNPAQALAHCSVTMEMAVGEKCLPRSLIGRLLGPFVKSIYSNERPFDRNSPTDKHLIVDENRDFATERERLSALIERFCAGGAEGCTTHPHCFFGKLTPAEWATGMYKHVDHHLRQFGV